MIRYLKHDEINKGKWDEALVRSSNRLMYAYSWYLDIVSPNWEALVEDDYQSIMPLPCRHKFGINYLFPPFFTQQLGVFSCQKLDTEKINAYIKAIPPKFRFAEINLNSFNSINLKNIKPIERLNLELDLNQSYPDLQKVYSSNLKRNLKKAEKAKLSIQENIDAKLLIKLFRENRGRDLEALKDKDYQNLEVLIKTCIEKGKGKLIGVECNSEICAGAFFAEDLKRSIFLFSGMNSLGKENAAMPFLIDQYIQRDSEQAITLDFEGSNQVGLARFYKSFGAHQCIYLQIKINRLPFFLKWFKQ